MVLVFKEKEKVDPSVRDVLKLLGMGVFLAAILVMPGLAILGEAVVEGEREERKKGRARQWGKYNLWRLRQLIKRLHQQKMVKVVEKNGEPAVVLTKKGKIKFLRYNLEEMEIKRPKRWDGKWRLIIYDVPTVKKQAQQVFRDILKRLNFFRLQKSVYLYPFHCENEIEFLRQYYDLGENVVILTVSGLEGEVAYKKYFDL